MANEEIFFKDLKSGEPFKLMAEGVCIKAGTVVELVHSEHKDSFFIRLSNGEMLCAGSLVRVLRISGKFVEKEKT